MLYGWSFSWSSARGLNVRPSDFEAIYKAAIDAFTNTPRLPDCDCIDGEKAFRNAIDAALKVRDQIDIDGDIDGTKTKGEEEATTV